MDMGIAIGIFLGLLPVLGVVLATRPPHPGSITRVASTVLAPGAPWPDPALIGPHLRRRRIHGAFGAVVGLWATASWASATWEWDGLLSESLPANASVGAGSVALAGGSFRLSVNAYGILVGFAVGTLLAEWARAGFRPTHRRAALLAPRGVDTYLRPGTRYAVGVGATAASIALVVATVIPSSLTSRTGEWPRSPWWALILLAVGVAAALTRPGIMTAATHAATGDEVAVREITRALTVATLTIVALAAFGGSTATTLLQFSTRFGWGWGDGIATAGLLLALVAIGLTIAAFITPAWLIEVDAPVAETSEAVNAT
jgi:hypothetical protein